MKNKIKNLFKILVVTAGCLMFASFSPSLDGRAVVVDDGVFPQGLFAKTVGYLPGDIITVTNIAGDATVDLLVIGALDPSEGVAIMLSPEAALAMGIEKGSNNIVKITKRSGQDERVYGNAVISKSTAEIEDWDDESYENIGAEENTEAFDDSESEEEAFVEPETEAESDFEEESEEAFAEETESESAEETEPAEESDFTEPEAEYEEDFEEPEVEEEAFEEPEEEAEAETESEEAEEPEEEAVEEEAFEDEALEESYEEEFEPEETEENTEESEEPEEEAVDEEAFEDESPAPEEEDSEEALEEEAFEEEEAAEEEFTEDELPAEEEFAEEELPAEESPVEEEAAEAEEYSEEGPEAIEEKPAEEAFEADELGELPAETEPVEAPAEEASEEEFEDEPLESEELEEYEAIVLVPVESNPPEVEETVNEPVEEDEVEDVVSEDELEAIEEDKFEEPAAEINKSVSTITLKPVEETKAPAASSYDKYLVPSLKDLQSGKYYIQIAVYSNDDNILEVINKYGNNYPVTIVPMAGGVKKQVLIGPVTMDEYKVVLERFKSYGFKDAFLRKVR